MMKDGHILLVEKCDKPWVLRWEPYDEEFDCGAYVQSSSLGDAPMDTWFRIESMYEVGRMLDGKVEIFELDEWNDVDEIIRGPEAITTLLEGKTLRCVTKEKFGSDVVMSGRLYKFENGGILSKFGNSNWFKSWASLTRLLGKEFVVIE